MRLEEWDRISTEFLRPLMRRKMPALLTAHYSQDMEVPLRPTPRHYEHHLCERAQSILNTHIASFDAWCSLAGRKYRQILPVHRKGRGWSREVVQQCPCDDLVFCPRVISSPKEKLVRHPREHINRGVVHGEAKSTRLGALDLTVGAS